MAEGTGVYFAAMQSYKYNYPYYSDENALGRQRLEQWTTFSDYCWLWVYGAYHTRPIYFYDSYNFHNSDAYQAFAKAGVEFVFDENIDYSSELTGFNALKTYIESKLMWDSSLDQNVLMDKFFNAMYKEAGDTMYKLFMDYRTHFAYIMQYGQKKLNNVQNYAPSDFLRWIDYLDKALLEIEKYKESDSNLYNLIKERIDIEAACPLHCMLELYGDTRGTPPFSSKDRAMYIARLTDIATRYPGLSYDTYITVLSFVQGLS